MTAFGLNYGNQNDVGMPARKVRPLRIGIDCRTMLNPISGERAGVGHYTFHIVKALLEIDRVNEYVLYFDHRMPRAVTDNFANANVSIRRLPFSKYSRLLPFAYSHLLLSSWLLRDQLDVFHATANVMPLTYNRPTVVTIHDLAIYQHPEWFPTQIASTKLLVPQTLKKAARIIAVSQTTKQDLRELFGVPGKKISVVYEAADTALLKLKDGKTDVRKQYGLPKKYILYVGTVEPRKSLTSLIQAWQRLVLMRPAVTKDAMLVIAGGVGFKGDEVLKLLKTLNAASIKYLGYVSHNHKVLLMQNATAFVFPTLYEGFGLPVLEAMQLGVPVITSDISSIPEVTGSAAKLTRPEDVEEIARAIKEVLTKPAIAKRMSVAGKRQAKKFSWTKAARETLKVYRTAAQV